MVYPLPRKVGKRKIYRRPNKNSSGKYDRNPSTAFWVILRRNKRTTRRTKMIA